MGKWNIAMRDGAGAPPVVHLRTLWFLVLKHMWLIISSTFSLTDKEMMTGGEGGSLSQPGIRNSREDEA